MRFSTVLVILSAAFVTTSEALLETRQSGYAPCALQCLSTTDRGSCAADDTKCLCNNKKFVNDTTTCIQTSCTGDDLEKSIAAAVQLCRVVGVTLTSSVPVPTSTPPQPSSTASSPASGASNNNSAISNGVNVLFALSALGLIGYAL